jgi:hypothetical protein
LPHLTHFNRLWFCQSESLPPVATGPPRSAARPPSHWATPSLRRPHDHQPLSRLTESVARRERLLGHAAPWPTTTTPAQRHEDPCAGAGGTRRAKSYCRWQRPSVSPKRTRVQTPTRTTPPNGPARVACEPTKSWSPVSAGCASSVTASLWVRQRKSLSRIPFDRMGFTGHANCRTAVAWCDSCHNRKDCRRTTGMRRRPGAYTRVKGPWQPSHGSDTLAAAKRWSLMEVQRSCS